MTRLRSTAFLLVLVTAAPAPAAFVAVANYTDREVRFTVAHPGGAAREETLAAGECRLVPVGRQPEASFIAGDRVARFGLAPYTAYVFKTQDNVLALHGVELAVALPKTDDVPALPVNAQPLRIPVHLLVDNAEVRARAVWEKALRERLSAASDVLERQAHVRFEVVAVGEWSTDPGAGGFDALAKGFETTVTPDPRAKLAIGYASRAIR